LSAHAQRLRLRCFIEGVEVPIIAASVEARPNSPVAASIQIPPLAEATRFLPRSLVHVFFLDFYGDANPHAYPKGEKSTPTTKANPSAYQLADASNELGAESDHDFVQDIHNQRYKLLFAGEMMGFQWTKTPSNRSIVLQCMDLSNYWDYAYQFNNTDIFGPGIKALFSGGSTNLFTDFLTDEGSVILQLLRKKPRNYPQLKGLLAGIVSVLEGIGGSYYGDKKIGGTNVFFSLAELRLHITQMITAYDKDPTSKNLMNADGYDGLFGRTLGGLGSQVSFRQAINALQSMIFHETFGQPCPLYVPGSFGAVSGQKRQNLTDYLPAEFISEGAKALSKSCDSLLDHLSDAAVGNEAGPKKDVRNRMILHLTGAVNLCTKALNQLKAVKLPELVAIPPLMSTGRGALALARTEISNKWSGNVMSPALYKDTVNRINRAKKAFDKVLDQQVVLSKRGEGVPARLNQQIFRPDVWFAPPPRCNVLFPDQYTQMSYTRSFMAEPTRLLLKTNDEFFGEDELFDNFFFAPKSVVVNVKKGDPNLQKLFSGGVLDHELFTGVLPVFEKMGELNIFAAQSGVEKGKHLKVGLAQRSTNFLYFKYRFAARSMSLSCRFNPYIACGFPGLIIDRYVDLGVIERHNILLEKLGKNARELKNVLGTHFLGNFTEVSHTVDQHQGSTNINVGYARQYEESVEFLGAVQKEQTVRSRFGADALRKTVVGALNPPGAGSLGPNYGVVVRSLDVTASYVSTDLTTGPRFPLYRGPRKRAGEGSIEVPCGVSARAKDYGPEVADFIGNPDQIVTFKALEIQEEVPRYRTEKVDMHAEEYIRPGWYGPCWKPNEIGKVYDFFFKTGSITDKTQVGDPQGASTGGQSTPANDALAQSVLTDSPFTSDDQGNVALLTLDEDAGIQQAVQFLVLTYSYMKQAGDINIDDFIKAYTWRPIASMVDMFGTYNLKLSTDGARVLEGFEGFHSRAFGQYADLFGLATPEVESILGVTRGEAAAARMDTRKRKQDAVLDYITALQLSRAVLG